MDDRTFSKRLALRLDELKMSQAELSRQSGISKARISQYIHGAYRPSGDAIVKLAKALLCTEEYLLGHSHESNAISGSKRLKILGEVRCGLPALAEEIYDGEIIADAHIDADFCLRAKGDSMIGARICDGDIVYIKRTDSVANGDIAVVIIDGEATLKRVYFYPDSQKLILVPENKKYKPLTFSCEELANVRIFGKAIAFTSKLF